MKSRETSPADSARKTSAYAGAGRVCFIFACFAICFATNLDNASAGCARERHFANEVDTHAISGLPKEQLLLMPAAMWDYSAGTIKITFAVPAKRCDGCHCRRPGPVHEPDFHTIIDSVRLPSPISGTFVILRDTDRDGGSKIEEPQFLFSSMRRSPLERPPNIV